MNSSGVRYPLNLFLLPIIVFVSVFTVRYLLASQYTVYMPPGAWDQWDSELTTVLAFKNHSLTWKYLFTPHNEHMVFLPKLYWILMYCINGSWNLLIEAKAQVLFIALTALLFSLWLIKDTGKINYISHILIICLFSVPFDIDNVGSGFQVQIYLLFMFSMIGLRLVSHEMTLGIGKFILIALLSLCAFFSMAAGALLPAIAGMFFAYYFVKSGFRTWKFIVYALLMFILFVALFFFIPVIPGHQAMKVKSLAVFLNVLLTRPKFIMAFVPIVCFALYYLFKRKFPETKYNFAILLYGYSIAIYFLCIYSRHGIAPRHVYLFLSSCILGFIFLADAFVLDKKRLNLALNLSKILVCIVLLSRLDPLLTALNTFHSMQLKAADSIGSAIELGRKEGKNACRTYLEQERQANQVLSYPLPDRLAGYLTNSEFLSLLPSAYTEKTFKDVSKNSE